MNKIQKIPKGEIGIDIEIGMTKKSSLKDISDKALKKLEKHKSFDKKNIYELHLYKRLSKKEFIDIDIYKLNY